MMYELAKSNYCILIADSSKFLVLLKHKQHHVGGQKILQHYKKSFNDSHPFELSWCVSHNDGKADIRLIA